MPGERSHAHWPKVSGSEGENRPRKARSRFRWSTESSSTIASQSKPRRAAAYSTADRIGSQGVNPFVSSCVTATLRVMNFRALLRRATVAPRLALYWRALTCVQLKLTTVLRQVPRSGAPVEE